MEQIIYLDISASFASSSNPSFKKAIQYIQEVYDAKELEGLLLFGEEVVEVTEFLPDVLKALTELNLSRNEDYQATLELAGVGTRYPKDLHYAGCGIFMFVLLTDGDLYSGEDWFKQ